MASDIDATASEISITVALSANEAITLLDERDDVDCLVVDYRMPEVDGLQLLERVRETYPQLPFLLMTRQGSEEVAARAIDAGVTDYIIKEPVTDQTVQFVNKIRSAVEQYKLQQAIEESEERYRKVTEQSRDAICILQEGRFVFWNERLTEMTRRTADELRTEDILATVIHRDDYDQLHSVVEEWRDDNDALHETRIVQPDETIRHCEVTGRAITYEDDDALLLTIRDVSKRNQRERELAWERELNRNVQKALVEAHSRDELERTIADQLRRQGYELVWLGGHHGDRLSVRVLQGAREYIETIEQSLGEVSVDSEPAIWAGRTGEPKFVQDFESLFDVDWCETALALGYRSGAGVPLVYNDISYGVLAVYHDQPSRFDEAEQRLLRELTDTMAFAIHSLENESALASDHTVEVTVGLNDGNYYLTSLAREGIFVDCERVQIQGTVPETDGGVVQYLTIDGTDTKPILSALENHPDVESTQVITEADPLRLQVAVSDPVPEAQLASWGVIVRSTVVEADSAVIELEVQAKSDIQPHIDLLKETFGSVSVRSFVERKRENQPTRVVNDDLTEKQAAALQAAYHHGYFEQPRKNSATEIADALGITHPTFLRHLRVAQQKQFERLFE